MTRNHLVPLRVAIPILIAAILAGYGVAAIPIPWIRLVIVVGSLGGCALYIVFGKD